MALTRRIWPHCDGQRRWVFGCTIAALSLVTSGLVNPVIATAAMALSWLFVVSTSLRLCTVLLTWDCSTQPRAPLGRAATLTDSRSRQ